MQANKPGTCLVGFLSELQSGQPKALSSVDPGRRLRLSRPRPPVSRRTIWPSTHLQPRRTHPRSAPHGPPQADPQPEHRRTHLPRDPLQSLSAAEQPVAIVVRLRRSASPGVATLGATGPPEAESTSVAACDVASLNPGPGALSSPSSGPLQTGVMTLTLPPQWWTRPQADQWHPARGVPDFGSPVGKDPPVPVRLRPRGTNEGCAPGPLGRRFVV